MRAYRYVWLGVVYPVGWLGVAAALISLPVVAVTALVICPALIGYAAGAYIAWQEAAAPFSRSRYAAWASAAVGGSLATAGLLVILGGTGAIVTLLLVATSPHAVRWYSDRLPARPAESGSKENSGGEGAAARSIVAPQVYASAALLPHDQLCLAWRTSFTVLQNTSDIDERARLAQCRRGFLDELERRDPQGFARWLAEGARAASDPGRYMTATGAPPSRGNAPDQTSE